MSCPKCLQVPNSHSFTMIGKMDDIYIYYSAPAKALEYKETAENMENFKLHLNEVKGKKWIWIFDCHGMEQKHHTSMNFMLKISSFIIAEHQDLIQGFWFIRQNIWMKTALKFLKGFFKAGMISKIRVFEGDKLELYVNLQKNGLSGPTLNSLFNTA